MTIFKVNANPSIWLDYIQYANRLFNPSQQNIWSNPVAFLSVYGQGQSLLRSDVINLPLLPFYTNWLKDHSEEMEALRGKKLKMILKKILSLDEPKQNIQEVLKGISHLYQDKQPIVIIVPSPQLWLMEAASLTGTQVEGMDENVVDASAMYLAEWLRHFSEAGLAAIVIEEAVNSILSLEEMETLYQPLNNVARHYQWEIGYWGKTNDIYQLPFSSFYFSPSSHKQEGNPVFLLPDSWWTDPSEDCLLSETGVVYGAIPEDARPELVLSKLKGLRMKSTPSKPLF